MKAESCLHKAVEGGSLRVVQYLIDKCGLDPKLQNRVRHYRKFLMPYICNLCIRICQLLVRILTDW